MSLSARQNPFGYTRDGGGFANRRCSRCNRCSFRSRCTQAGATQRMQLEVEGKDLAYEVPDDPIAYSIIDNLRRHKPEIVAFSGTNATQSSGGSPTISDRRRWSVCALLRRWQRKDDPFVIVFVGEDRADIHASCYPRWLAEQESSARVAIHASSPQ